nr:hypothetical protein [uncultured Kingella sp.]
MSGTLLRGISKTRLSVSGCLNGVNKTNEKWDDYPESPDQKAA